MPVCRLLKRVLSFCLLLAASSHAATITDIAGRNVEVPRKVERILLGEGRFVPTLAILERQDPLRRVVGMLGEFERLDPAGYTQYREKFPHIDKITRVGRLNADSFSVEQAIALAPDLAIFALNGHGPSPAHKEVIARLEKAGITVAFIDFRQEPLKNAVPSMRVLGSLLGREAEAGEYIAFYEKEMARVTQTTKPTVPVSVFLDNHAGLSDGCCSTMGRGMMGSYLEAAGAANIAAEMIPGMYGTLSLEYLLTHQPDMYIGTAVGTVDGAEQNPQRIILGAGVPAKVARASLQRAVQRKGIAELDAVKQGRVFGIWHHFYNSPFNVIAVQVFAKWTNPKANARLDPEATLKAVYERFQPVPLSGTYWISLQPAQ